MIDCDHRTPPASEVGYPYVAIPQLRNGRIDLSDVRRITRGHFEEWTKKAKPVAYDVVLSRRCNPGETAYVPPNLEFALGQNLVLLRADGSKVFPPFLRWLVRGPEWWEQIGKFLNVGAVFDSLRCADVPNFELRIPPLPEQRAIAHILGTLDDKIELNRKMNETLEAMARALFKSWFVDFDPVRAKAEGRDTGLPKEIADLFPDSFVDSELGEIPRGWGVGKLGDILTQRVERCVVSSETAVRPYVPIDCISSKSLCLTESKSGEEAQSSLAKFYKGDLLFGAMRPYFHKVCIAPFDGTTRTTAFVLFPKAKEDFAFATLLLHHPDTIDYATRHSTGSTIPYAVWNSSMEEMPLIIPSSEIRCAYDRSVRPLLDRIPEPYFQNRALASMRDMLLPRLISGELCIEEPKRFIKEGG
ncbi:MAG: restriction endonuclease subunit S [Planctomycetota bacterium]